LLTLLSGWWSSDCRKLRYRIETKTLGDLPAASKAATFDFLERKFKEAGVLCGEIEDIIQNDLVLGLRMAQETGDLGHVRKAVERLAYLGERFLKWDDDLRSLRPHLSLAPIVAQVHGMGRRVFKGFYRIANYMADGVRGKSHSDAEYLAVFAPLSMLEPIQKFWKLKYQQDFLMSVFAIFGMVALFWFLLKSIF